MTGYNGPCCWSPGCGRGTCLLTVHGPESLCGTTVQRVVPGCHCASALVKCILC